MSSELVWYAHTPNDDGQWHELMEHLQSVAELAAEFAAVLGASEAARLLGWWHDAGKIGVEWQQFIVRAATTTQRMRGPDHTSAGTLALVEVFPPLALCVMGHHGGLKTRGALKDRVERARKEADKQLVRDALVVARRHIEPRCPAERPDLPDVFKGGRALAQRRQCAMAWRLLHSCLIDADCLDTEAHCSPERAASRVNAVRVASCLARLEAHLSCMISGAQESVLNTHREQMLGDAQASAALPPGFFSLTMPTGGGKTLSGMAFALKHAQKHGLRRVIVAIPFTSIIEQNAQVYREVMGEDAVLEHHSAVSSRGDDDDDVDRWQRLAAQNWDAPVVVTTNVQLLESLFACKNSRLRKLHRIARSVIIFDEAQTLPPELLALTLDGLKTLVEEFGCTIVFSTATQPAFDVQTLGDEVIERFRPCLLDNVREIISTPAAHFEALRRVNYTLHDEPLRHEQLAVELLPAHEEDQGSALVILNTIGDAHALLGALHTHDAERAERCCLHLSTRMCPAHRMRTLAEVRARLRSGKPCVLVSTQVVEAGVDLDFPTVWRVMGPLDSIVQAAGRCNREGRAASGEVHIFTLDEGRSPPGIYRAATDRATLLLAQEGVERLHEPELFAAYFAALYGSRGESLDAHDLLRLEAEMSYPEVARLYRLIDDDSIQALIPERALLPEERSSYYRALTMLRQHQQHGGHATGGLLRAAMRTLHPFIVSLRRAHVSSYMSEGLLAPLAPELELYQWRGDYDALYGLRDQHVADAWVF